MEASTPLFSTGRPEVRNEKSDANLPTTNGASSAIHRQSNSVSIRTTSKNPDRDQSSPIDNLSIIISVCVVPLVISAIALIFIILRSRRNRKSYENRNPQTTDLFTSSDAVTSLFYNSITIIGYCLMKL